MSILWYNGAWQEETQAVFTAQNRMCYGDGIFDTMLAIDGSPLHFQKHLERIIHNAKILHISINIKPDSVAEIVTSLLARNAMTEGRAVINIMISRGESARGLTIPSAITPDIIIKCTPAPELTSAPTTLITAQSVRRNEGSPLSQIKSMNYGDNILAKIEADNAGADDALMLNNAGRVTCATSSNIFAVRENQLVTPPLRDGVLAGVTRALVIERLNAVEANLTPDDLLKSDGVYITNSVFGARAVHSLDGAVLPSPTITIDKDFHLHA